MSFTDNLKKSLGFEEDPYGMSYSDDGFDDSFLDDDFTISPEQSFYEIILIKPQSIDDMDYVFDQACLPVLLTYDSDVIAKYDDNSAAYQTEIKSEFEELYNNFTEKISKGVPLTVHLFLLPLKTKAELVSAFDDKLKILQQI